MTCANANDEDSSCDEFCIEIGECDSNNGEDEEEMAADDDDAKEGWRASCDGESEDSAKVERQIMWDDNSSIQPNMRRTKSSNDTRLTSSERMYSFRMPQTATDTKSDGASVDYNFVLDNYLEFADDTQIPRLRGKDTDNVLLAAIHDSHWAVLVAVSTASCFLTFSLSNYSPFLRADLSQALVITLVLATFPEVAASSGAGAFAGMVSMTVVPNFGWLTLLAFVLSVVWMLFYRFRILVGCGGRLGTCAFISMNITTIVFLMPSGTISWSLYGDATQLWSQRLELVPSILTVLACTFLSAAGGAVRLKSAIPLNPVQAPTTIALLCMLILEPTGFVYTGPVDAGLAVGSFVAMASDQYLPTILDFVLSGFLAGLWILLLDPFFNGFGGKKGFTSFCGFATYIVIRKVVERLRRVGKDE